MLRRNIVIGLFLPFAASSSLVYAQSLQPGDLDLTRERQERLLEEQQRRLEELRNLPAPSAPAPAEQPALPAPCFDIQGIELKGATLIEAAAQQRLLADFQGRCLAAGDLNEVLRRITAHYIDRGFVTSRAYLPEQDLGNGVLKVIVVEGRLEGIDPGPDSRLTPREIDIAFPGHVGGPLNLRELEQLVDQLNRLPSNRAGVELVPGEALGGSRAGITNQAEKPWRLTFVRHNDGQRSTGQQQWALGLELDSPLGLADQLMVRGGANARETSARASDNGFLQYSVPWGWWNFAYTYTQSYYRTLNEASGFAFELSGVTRHQELRAERLLHRDAMGKTAVNIAIGQTESRNYIESSLIGVSSQRLSELGVGFNHGRRVGTAFANLDLGWQQGITAFGGRSDHHPVAGAPRALYNNYTLTASYLHPFTVGTHAFSFDSLINAQKSEDVLFGPRRISVGGPGSVRGFKGQALSGDSGAYWRNQLRWRTPVGADMLGSSFASVFSELGATLAFDVGVIERNRTNRLSGQHGRLSGRAVEFSARGKHVRVSLVLAESLARPDALQEGEHPIHFRIEFFL